MSKFSDLAGMTRETLAKWDAEADDIIMEHHKLSAEGDELFRQYRARQAEKREGFKAMRDAIRDLAGGNGAPNAQATEAAGLADSSGSFPAPARPAS